MILNFLPEKYFLLYFGKQKTTKGKNNFLFRNIERLGVDQGLNCAKDETTNICGCKAYYDEMELC